MSDDPRYFDTGPDPVLDPGRQPWELPLAVLAAALAVGLGAASIQLYDERARLHALSEAQTAQVQQAVKFREQLQSLGAETARLADGGDAAAKKVVEAMKQQGVTLKVGDK